MQDAVRETLTELIKKYGTSLVDDPRRVEGLLRDLCGENKREINALIGAMKLRVPTDLLNTSNVPIETLSARLIKRIEDDLSMKEEMARWAVESWAVALGKELPFKVSYEEKQTLPVQEKIEPPKENENSEAFVEKTVNLESQNNNLVLGKHLKFIVCSSCNYKNTLSQRYCSNCYKKLDSSQISFDDNLEYTICPSCQYKNPKNNHYCGNCSASLKQIKDFDHEMKFIVCPKCGFENLRSNHYCLSCYKRLSK